jgi:hypothetical protein
MAKKDTSSRQANDSIASQASDLAALSSAGASAWFGIIAESGQFVARRLEEDLKAQKALMGCKTPAEVMQVQADYFRTAAEQYSEQTNRVLGILSGTMGESLVPSKSLFARRYDDVPL